MRTFVARVLTLVNVVALIALCGLSGLLLAATLPAMLGYESFVVQGLDVPPALHVGDLALVAAAPATQLSVGDVVSYRTPHDPETVIIRALDGVERDATGRVSLRTRSQAGPDAEPLMVEVQVKLGRLMYVIPRLGLVVNFVNEPLGRLLLLGLPVVLLGLDAVRKRLRRPRSLGHEQRIEALLDTAQRALRSGHLDLAVRAAQGVLMLDSGNMRALELELTADSALKVDREHVAA